MIFELLAAIGLAGMALMTFMGAARFGHHSGASGHAGHTGHLALRTGHASHTGAHASHPHAQVVSQNGQNRSAIGTAQAAPLVAGNNQNLNYWSLVPSPMDLSSLCFGAGIAGMLAIGHVPIAMLTTISVVGALVFCFGITRPLVGVMLRFASTPSEGLEGTVALTAEAITKFDAKGQGLVCVNMEGQLVQLLGKLSKEEIGHGTKVLKGEQVVVTDVDPKRGTCTVTRELSL